VQVGAPSRDHLARYQALSREVDETVAAVNAAYGNGRWQPVVYLREHREPPDIAAMYRAADVCVVSSLHDGMNLVAKEFIASRGDGLGVLVLSRFTGAARELHEALSVNPFAVDEFADALHQALSMPEDQQLRRMTALQARVQDHTVYDWAAGILRTAASMAEVA
jgi:trehalose 6-phosphate synthase/phosphatase